jgi:hypothetical protein
MRGKVMGILSGDIAALVFKPIINDGSGPIPLDGQMLNVLSEMDGSKNLGLIARTVGMNMTDIRVVISKLMELNVIQAVEETSPVLDRGFYDFLTEQLALITGPIAPFMVEDAVKLISNDESGISRNRAAELLEVLVRQIPEKTKKAGFVEVITKKITELY